MKFFTERPLLILFIFALLASGSLKAQENTSAFKDKIYVDEGGKLYWNKHTPFYLRITPDLKEGGVTLKTEAGSEPGQNFFDTEGINWIRSRWLFDEDAGHYVEPRQEILWPVYADGLAPVTSHKLEHSGVYVANGKHYYSEDVKIELNAKDAISGVRKIYYTLNGQVTEYTKPLTFSGKNGESQNLTYYAIDNVDNKEESKTPLDFGDFVIDNTPPVSSIAPEGPQLGNVLSPKSQLALSSKDQESGVKKVLYTLGTNQKQYYSNVNLSSLPDGDHKVTYHAIDQVNNKETEKSYDFYLDRTPPVASFKADGDSYISPNDAQYISARSKLTLTATDNKAGVDHINYNFDKSSLTEYSASIDQDLSEGKHFFGYTATDKVGNTATLKTMAIYVDHTAPNINLLAQGPEMKRNDTLFVHPSTVMKVKTEDNGLYAAGVAKVEYSINGQKKNYEQVGFQFDSPGYKSLVITTRDHVNNESVETYDVFVDNYAPEIAHQFNVAPIGTKNILGNEYDIYPKELKVYLSATDKHVGTEQIYYSLNDGPESIFVHPIDQFRDKSNVVINVRSIDYLGNESKSAFQFSVEAVLATMKKPEILTSK